MIAAGQFTDVGHESLWHDHSADAATVSVPLRNL